MIKAHEQQDPHEALRELCALSTTEALSAEEIATLNGRLASCSECRKLYSEYSAIASEGMPFLAGRYANGADAPAWNDAIVRQRLMTAADSIRESGPERAVVRALPLRAAYHWSKLAAAACLLISVGAGSYWLGRRNEAAAQSAYGVVVKRLQEIAAEKSSLDQTVAEYVRQASQFRAESSAHQREIGQLRTELHILDRQFETAAADATVNAERLKEIGQQRDALADRLQRVQQALQDSQTQIVQFKSVSMERDTLASRLRTMEERYRAAQTELAKLSDKLSGEEGPSVKGQLQGLLARIKEQQEEIKRYEQYLDSDRDVRELMGARQLYIADVFDVNSNGRTQKPFGRIFYTKGKSLIFYAFDLDPNLD